MKTTAPYGDCEYKIYPEVFKNLKDLYLAIYASGFDAMNFSKKEIKYLKMNLIETSKGRLWEFSTTVPQNYDLNYTFARFDTISKNYKYIEITDVHNYD